MVRMNFSNMRDCFSVRLTISDYHLQDLTNNNTDNEKYIRCATWRMEAFAVRRTMNSPTELK